MSPRSCSFASRSGSRLKTVLHALAAPGITCAGYLEYFHRDIGDSPTNYEILQQMVIVRNIWQKLSSIERRVTLIVTHFWRLFPQIFGETLLIVTNIWRNQTCFPQFYSCEKYVRTDVCNM